jgi:hypothetical protein
MATDVTAYSPITLRVGPSLAKRITDSAGAKPLVIDHYASRRCAVTVGDLRVRVAGKAAAAQSRADSVGASDYAEIDPIGDVPVLIERSLLEVVAGGAELKLAGPFFAPHLVVELDRPEDWLAFLETHPANRR